MNTADDQTPHYILGVQCYANHDSGAALIKFTNDGKVMDYVAISEERLIRKKHPYCFPIHSIAYCMDYFGLDKLSDIDLMVTDFIRLKRWFNSGPAYLASEFDYLKIKFDFDLDKIVTVSHHMAHAATAYYTSGFDDAAVMVVDGNGSGLQSNSFFTAKGTDITYLDSYKARGIGAAYTAISSWILDFGQGGEGKTMGLAPYGSDAPQALNLDGQFDGVRTDFSNFMRRMPHSDILNHIPPHRRKYPFKHDLRLFAEGDSHLDPYFSRVAFDIQAETERTLTHLGQSLYEQTGAKNVCLAGGVALNSVANKIMFDATDFENIFVFPACSDAGIPFGLALWGYYKSKKFSGHAKKRFTFSNAYTGKNYSESYIDDVMARHDIPHKKTEVAEVAGLIADGKIIGWFSGGSEYGPRALGHRSILGDSRRAEMRDTINIKIKHREEFRPFAPAILAEHCSEYFDIEGESPFMLLVADVLQPDKIPSVTHVDGTARVQTVTKEDNGAFYDLISEFNKITGVPVILNTSFNDAGEPIVETPEDALLCLLNTGMDVLMLENTLIDTAALDQEKLAAALDKERTQRIEDRSNELKSRFFPGFDQNECDHFIAETNRMAEWHALYRSKYELEKKIMDWHKTNARIVIVGTPDHTALLKNKINGFHYLNIQGFVDFNGSCDDTPGTAAPYPSLQLSDLGSMDVDEILISSHEYNFEIVHTVKKEFPGKSFYQIYDDSSRSFFDSLELFPAYRNA